MKRLLSVMMLSSTLITLAPTSNALTINTDNGGLNVLSIEDLIFMGTSFDITFPEGSFDDIFGVGQPPSLLPYFYGDTSGANSFAALINDTFNSLSTVPTSVGEPGIRSFQIPTASSATTATVLISFQFPSPTNWDISGAGAQVRDNDLGGTGRYALITEADDTGSVPTPATLTLLGLGLAGLGWSRRKRA